MLYLANISTLHSDNQTWTRGRVSRVTYRVSQAATCHEAVMFRLRWPPAPGLPPCPVPAAWPSWAARSSGLQVREDPGRKKYFDVLKNICKDMLCVCLSVVLLSTVSPTIFRVSRCCSLPPDKPPPTVQSIIVNR